MINTYNIQNIFRKYYPSIVGGSIFLLINFILILFYQKGFLILDQRGLFMEYAFNPLSGKFGHTIEYPVGAFLFFKLIAFLQSLIRPLFSSILQSYYFVFSFSIVISYLISYLVCLKLLKKTGVRFQLILLSYFVLFFYLMNPFLAMSTFDVIPATLVVLSVYYIVRDRVGLSAVFLALATAIKLYPIILMPALFFYVFFKKTRSIKFLLTFFTSLFTIVLFTTIWLPLPVQLDSYLYHVNRGIELQSLYGNFFAILHKLFFNFTAVVTYEYQTLQIYSENFAILSKFTFPILITILFIIYIIYLKKIAKEQSDILLYKYTLILVFAFVLFNKVLSAQFLLWILPLLLLYANVVKRGFFLILLFLLSAVLFPPLFYIQEDFVALGDVSVLLLTVRNVLLLVLFLFILFVSEKQDSKSVT